MALTLKEQHKIRRIRRINETSRKLATRQLDEQRTRRLVVEALDKQKFAEAAAVLKKLQDIEFGSMEYFKQAVRTAVSDVNDALGGAETVGGFASALGNVVKMAKTKLTDAARKPLPNALAFVSAMENAFEQAETLIQNNLPNNLVRGMKSGKIPQEKVMAVPVARLVGEKGNSLQNALTQAFQPEGLLAKLGLSWKKRYLDPGKAAETIMAAKLGDVIKAARSFKQGPQMSDFADDLGGAVQKNGEKKDPQTSSSGGSQPDDSKGNGDNSAPVTKDDVLQIDPYIRAQLIPRIVKSTGLSEEDVTKVLDTMARIAKTLKK